MIDGVQKILQNYTKICILKILRQLRVCCNDNFLVQEWETLGFRVKVSNFSTVMVRVIWLVSDSWLLVDIGQSPTGRCNN